jgi:hypothetical protein
MASGAPTCDAPLVAYCGDGSNALACPGDCFGTVAVSKGADACRKSAVSVAQCVPRCAPPLLQLKLSFKDGLDSAGQAAIAKLAQDLDAPLAKLVDAQSRLALLQTAAADLATEQSGDIADELAKLMAASPKDAGLACANKRLAPVPTWLDDQTTAIMKLQDEITQLLSVAKMAM